MGRRAKRGSPINGTIWIVGADGGMLWRTVQR